MTDDPSSPHRPPAPEPTLFEVLADLSAAGATDAELQQAAEQYLLDHQGTWASQVAVAVDLAHRLGVELPAELEEAAHRGATVAQVNEHLASAALVLGRDVLFAAGAYRLPPSDHDAGDVRAVGDAPVPSPAVDEVHREGDAALYRELCAQLLAACRGPSDR